MPGGNVYIKLGRHRNDQVRGAPSDEWSPEKLWLNDRTRLYPMPVVTRVASWIVDVRSSDGAQR